MIAHVRTEHRNAWHTVNTVTHVTHERCLRPIRFTTGKGTGAEHTTWVDCGRRLPADQQCPGCRIKIIPDNGGDDADVVAG